MTITATTCEITYTCNGSDTTFDFSFPILVTSDLKIYKVTIATGVETLQTLTTDYTLSAANNNEDYSDGGTVTTVGTAWSSSYQIRILRDLPKVQALSLEEGGPIRASALMAALDKLTMMIQEVANFTSFLITIYPYKDTAIADDGETALPTITNQGLCLVTANDEAGIWIVKSDGSTIKLVGTTNTAATDTDGSLCVYDAGTVANVKNRLGTTASLLVFLLYF